MDEWRWCNRCQTLKPLGDFYASRSGRVNRYCKPCHVAHQRRPEVHEHQRAYHYHYHLHRKFGISMEEAARLAAIEDCECCGRARQGERLHIDHDHQTGQVRGAICRSCNFAVGVLERENLVEAVRSYLSR